MNSITHYELSNPQKRIWLTELLYDRKDMSNIGYLIELKGEYDLEQLAQAVKHVVKANIGLHLRFKYTGDDKSKGDLVQYMPEYEEIGVEKINVPDEKELKEIIEEKHRQKFDINGKFLCSFAVFSIANKRFGLFEKANHLVADGISAVVVAREIIDTYKKLSAGEFAEVEKEYTYIDFLESEKEYIGSEKYNKDKEFWLQTFNDYRGEEINFQLNKDKINSLKVNRKSFQVPAAMIPSAEEYKANNRLSNFPLFMAALAIYFNRFLNHDDMVIGLPVHNRSKKIFRNMVGMFVSTIPCRIKFDEEWTFNECAAYIKKQLWEALKHQGYPFNHLAKDLMELNIDASRLLNVQLIELPGGNEADIEKRAFFSTQYNISQLSIYLNQQVSPALDDLDIAVDYHEDIFTEREVGNLFKRLTVILKQCIAEPEKKISELSLLEEAEYKELIYGLNDTEAPFPKDKTLPRLFEEQVSKNPGNIALEFAEKKVTYGELNDLAEKLAIKLQDAGITPGAIVGLLCERSIEAIVCVMGVLKAGGAYVPIDPNYPLERKNYIIENSGINILLVEKESAGQESELPDNRALKTMIIDYTALTEEKAGREFTPPVLSGNDLAYVIYTSGTTGNPKGTLLRHRNVINYICWGADFYVKGEQVAFPLYTSLSFDLTVTSIFIPLLTGNKIVIYRDSKEGLLIERVIKENKVDIIKLTPSHLKIVTEVKCPNPRVKSFIVGGEELKVSTARETDAYFKGNINIYNEYGPTETAVGCMIHAYDKNSDTGLAVPIGKPSHNVNIYILDENKRPLPLGIIGEIYIGGAGVARGYLKNGELTAQKFVDNPFVPGEKMYRSGDLGRWNLDKTLEFFGRCDEQVKIRGYRIEPGEIEKQLLNIPGTKDAVVDVVEDKTGQKSLCAYMVPVESIASEEAKAEWFSAANIRRKLHENLPDYMIPSFFVKLDKIPLTHNGKVDRRALPGPQITLKKGTGAMPAGEKEMNIRRIWSDVLAIDGIGMEDNFFELGGDSIKAVQIASRLNDMDLSVNARDILNHQTIDQLILNVDFDREKVFYDQGLIAGTRTLFPIESWFFEKNFKNPHYFNQSVLLEFKEEINGDILVKCFNELIRQHDGLRINADLTNKTLFYNNRHLKKDVDIEVINIPAGEAANPEDIMRETGEKLKASFDIRESLLIKAAVMEVERGGHYLLITAHHLVIDGVSWRILLEDLYNLYRGLSAGETVTLPRKTASLNDWAAGLREYSEREELAQEISYWEEAGLADFFISVGEADEKEQGSVKDRGKISFTLEQEQAEILSSGSRKTFRSDIEVMLVTALSIALHEFTGSKKIVVEMENHGRVLDEVDLSRTAGWFTAMYPKLITIDKENLVGRIKSVKEQLAHTPGKGIGYGVLKYLTQKITGEFKSRVRFNYLGQFDREVSNDIFAYSDLDSGEDIDGENALTTQIEIDCMILKGSLILDLYYSNRLFNKEKIADLLDKIKAALQQMVTYFESGDEVHFTPSDFDTVDLGEDDLEALFG
jgi:amino acid adenylation domain-containing protein/non-ribosomal peptide synthase protein (TIGR01720 family)